MPRPKAPIPIKAELTVVVAEPLLIVKLAELPVTIFDELAPIVTAPLPVVIALVPTPPSVISPFKETNPVEVVIFPPFQVSGAFIVNEAFVELAAARS